MLVLTRKTNQSIMIGDEIEVSILSVAGDKVRIGIDAPRDIAVFRKEVYEAIDEGGAGGVTPADGASAGADAHAEQ
jgi:carbon storage regulator